MKPIIVYNSKIPKLMSVFIDATAITLWPFIFVSYHKEYADKEMINHESIHIQQQTELWVIVFYVLYVYYWLMNIVDGEDFFAAYVNIPFEVEAYTNQNAEDYLAKREKHSWRNYVGKKLM